jgi:hypothetical protein
MLEEYSDNELIAVLIERGNYDLDNEGQAIIYTGVRP